MVQKPAFIAFTGVDDVAALGGMQALSARYPIEWGILIDDEQTEKPLFLKQEARRACLAAGGLRFAAHVCGEQAVRIANAPDTVTVDLTGFQRVQVNHSFSGSTQVHVDNTVWFGRKIGARSMLQCTQTFPDDARLDWLFDTSFGKGTAPSVWPEMRKAGPFCGFAGGINASNVANVLTAIGAEPGDQYWIDMESGIRTNDRLDLEKCEAVCKAVFG